MKVIFLDIDGVMNMYGSSCRTFMKPYGQHIEPHLVQRLNYIIEKTNAKIVISSSWRSDMEDLEKQLKEQGFKYWTHVIGKTCQPQVKNENIPYPRNRDCFLYNDRGEQINKWLQDTNFNIEKYIVVDDEVSDIRPHINSKHIFQTDAEEGLLNKDALHIVRMVNKNEE